MVRIEIVSGDPIPCTRHIVPQTNNRAITMIHNLARSAAATQIQKRLRGILVRHIHWRGEEIHDIETQSCSIGCQMEVTVGPQDHKACQADIVSTEPSESSPTMAETRRNKVFEISTLCKKNFDTIHIDGCDISNILKAMRLLGPREFEGLYKAVSIQQRQYYNQGHRTTYPLRISNAMDFEQDLRKAWVELTESAHQYPSISMPRKRSTFTVNSESTRARASVNAMVDIPNEFITLLAENTGVFTYPNPLVSNILALFGIRDEGRSHVRSEWSIIDFLRAHGKKTENSWERERCNLGIQILQEVARWEASNDDNGNIHSPSGQNAQTKLCEANLRISELVSEVENLRMQLKPVITGDETKQDEKTERTSRPSKLHKKQPFVKVPVQKQPQKKKGHQKATVAEPKQRSQSKINTVEIKFTEDRKKKKGTAKHSDKALSKPNKIIRAAPSLQKKKTGGNDISSQRSREASSQNPGIANRERSALRESQYVQSSGSEPAFRDTTKRFNDILERLRFT